MHENPDLGLGGQCKLLCLRVLLTQVFLTLKHKKCHLLKGEAQVYYGHSEYFFIRTPVVRRYM